MRCQRTWQRAVRLRLERTGRARRTLGTIRTVPRVPVVACRKVVGVPRRPERHVQHQHVGHRRGSPAHARVRPGEAGVEMVFRLDRRRDDALLFVETERVLYGVDVHVDEANEATVCAGADRQQVLGGRADVLLHFVAQVLLEQRRANFAFSLKSPSACSDRAESCSAARAVAAPRRNTRP